MLLADQHGEIFSCILLMLRFALIKAQFQGLLTCFYHSEYCFLLVIPFDFDEILEDIIGIKIL